MVQEVEGDDRRDLWKITVAPGPVRMWPYFKDQIRQRARRKAPVSTQELIDHINPMSCLGS